MTTRRDGGGGGGSSLDDVTEWALSEIEAGWPELFLRVTDIRGAACSRIAELLHAYNSAP